MKKITVVVTIVMVLLIFSGCSEKSGLSEIGDEAEYEIKVREHRNVSYTDVTDEVIKNNVLYLLKEIVSQEKVVISNGGSAGPSNSKRIKITSDEGEKYIIGFYIYYESEYVDGGRATIGINSDKGQTDYYYDINKLEKIIRLMLTDSRTFTAKVKKIKPLEVVSPGLVALTLHIEDLPENIKVGSEVEITLGKMTDTSKGLVAESIIKK